MTNGSSVISLTEYNQDEFHLLHAQTVENTMRYFARELGFADEEDFWGIDEKIIHAPASHGYAWMDTGRSDSENNRCFEEFPGLNKAKKDNGRMVRRIGICQKM